MIAGSGRCAGKILVRRTESRKRSTCWLVRGRSSAGRNEIRILFVFDPVRRAVLLVAGDKAGNWKRWYDINIPIAEERYRPHLDAMEES